MKAIVCKRIIYNCFIRQTRITDTAKTNIVISQFFYHVFLPPTLVPELNYIVERSIKAINDSLQTFFRENPLRRQLKQNCPKFIFQPLANAVIKISK